MINKPVNTIIFYYPHSLQGKQGKKNTLMLQVGKQACKGEGVHVRAHLRQS